MSKRVLMISFAPMLFDARIQKEAMSLRDAGYKVVIVYVEDERMLESLKNKEESLQKYNDLMYGIKSIGINLFSKEANIRLGYLRKFLISVELVFRFTYHLLKERFDIVHVHDLKPAFLGVLWKIIFRKKLVYDAHEFEYTTGGAKLEFLFKKYERIVTKFSDLNFTVNKSIKEYMDTQYGISTIILENKPRSKEVILPVNFEDVVGAKGKFLIYVGYVTPYIRGIEQAIKALEYLESNTFILILGVGRINEFKSHIDKFLVNNNLIETKKKIFFLDPVDPDSVVDYLSSADVSLLLYQKNNSNGEFNSPNKLFQSILAHVPILASNNKTFPIIINGDAENGKLGEIVDETDPFQIAAKIQTILSNGKGYYQKGLRSMARNVSWEVEEKKLLCCYRKL